jgi:asparagine synthase (glutamine-hydrolysing)
MAGPGGPSQWIVARALRRAGVKVVHSGQGGDELFGGYERHRLLLRRDAGSAPDPAPGYEAMARALASDDPVAGLLFRGRALLPWMEPARAAGVRRAAEILPRGRDLAERTLAFEWEVLLPGLLAVEDRCAAAFGMEARCPLLDPVLVRATRAVPLAAKSPADAPRRLFRRILGDRLPAAAARRRDKMGFPLPLDAWLAGPLREHLLDPTTVEALREIGFTGGIARALESGVFDARNRMFLLGIALGAGVRAPVRAAAEAAS